MAKAHEIGTSSIKKASLACNIYTFFLIILTVESWLYFMVILKVE